MEYLFKSCRHGIIKQKISVLIFTTFVFLLSINVAGASHNNTPTAPARPLPPSTVTPIPFEGPAPWGTNPATVPGAVITGAITGNGFLSEVIALPDGRRFWYQKIENPNFLNEAYIKKENVFQRNPTDPQGSVDVSGNVIFNVKISDPAAGLTIRSWKDGFKAPISIHADIVESKVAALTSGFNEMDMHFSQTPFLDTRTGQVLVRQDMGVWITGIGGIDVNDVSENQRFVPGLGNLLRTTATSVVTGRRLGGDDNDARSGDIDFWNDLEMVKILNPATQQIVTFSRCNEYGDPQGRLEEEFRSTGRSRGGCSGSTGGRIGENGLRFRPAIVDHSADGFQLTPIDWDRWRGGGNNSLNSGGPGGSGGTTPFPGPTVQRRRDDDD